MPGKSKQEDMYSSISTNCMLKIVFKIVVIYRIFKILSVTIFHKEDKVIFSQRWQTDLDLQWNAAYIGFNKQIFFCVFFDFITTYY